MLFDDPIGFLLMSTGRIPAILFALAMHEAAHAWMSLRCGDDTAARMGRITLNPFAHLDPVGSIGIFLSFIGWGKPVPYVERNLKNPRRDSMLIAAAGPVSNLILAAISGLVFRVLYYVASGAEDAESTFTRIVFFLLFLFSWSVVINLSLCFFNLIPVFPLDGEKILLGLLPYKQAYAYASFRQYGPMVLLLIVMIDMQSQRGGLITSWINLMALPFSYLFTGHSFDGVFSMVFVSYQVLWGQ